VPLEIETKFKVGQAEQARNSLARIGAKLLSKELEKDVYYAGPKQANVTAVRLRTAGRKALFTIKSFPEAGAAASPGMKVLEETEIVVDDAPTFERLLALLGFVPQFRKEKIRETYLWRGVPIFLDELPHLGFFLEIEAPEHEIKTAAEALGLDIETAVGETYMQLFSRYKEVRNEPDLELVFGG
jgi:predicted adenylyl cyclase CyaB